ncbi:c-type cytochrome [Pseudomonadota bacterium]
MKRIRLMPVVMVMLLAGCQQSEPPKSESESHSLPVTVENVLQQEEAQPEKPAQVITRKSEPVVEKMEALPVVAEKIATKEIVKQQVAAEPIEVSAPENEPAVVEMVMGNTERGAKLTKGKCGACHYFDKDRKKVGPTLMGIYGRAPVIDGVPYAAWDGTALDAWLSNPKAVKPKTKMGFKGISDKTKRDDIIAYLKTL